MTPAADESRSTLLLRGVLDMCVLALVGQQPTHAYDVVQRLRDLGLAQVSYGTIYPLITRLRRQGLIGEQSESSPSGPRRNVLNTTAAGEAALGRWVEQWRTSNATIENVLATTLVDRGGAIR